MFQPRLYQTAACQAINAGLANGESGLLAVIPTGGGKTLVMADLIRQWITQWPETRVCVLAHTKELVEQNAAKFVAYWQAQNNSAAPIGIYCAGLNQRNTTASVLFASIQSVSKKAMHLGGFDVLLIDEAHHIPTKKEEGIWRRFITDATRANPNVRIVGLSATPYRMGSGSIVGDKTLLRSICYEVSVLTLINDGYLCPLITRSSAVQADTSGLHTRQGEYIAAEVEALMNQDALITGAVQEMMSQGADRKSWIVFCAGVAHAGHVCDALNRAGIPTGLVTGKTPRQERDRTINAFKAGQLRALCNVNVLSEGFDHPGIDLVALLRPTKSPGLYYQQVGRAFRRSPGKQDALILDFAGVIAEHGPVDQIRPSFAKGSDDPGEVPQKKCPECGNSLHLSVITCPVCGYVFSSSSPPKHKTQAADTAILSSQIKPIRYDISRVAYSRYMGKSGIPTLKVDYFSGILRVASEWICLNHTGYARQKSMKWWNARSTLTVLDVDSALAAIRGIGIAEPVAIYVQPALGHRKYPEIVNFEWTTPSVDWEIVA
jgi:DNA repair protein RadD